MSGKKGMVHYDLATKLEALRLHKEGLPYRVIAERLRIGIQRESKNGCLNTDRRGKQDYVRKQRSSTEGAAQSGSLYPETGNGE
jgi:hypothetical protein